MFAALSTNEDKYADKINLFVAMAPIARMKGDDTDKLASDMSSKLIEGAMKVGIYELYGPGWNDNKEFLCTLFPCGKDTVAKNKYESLTALQNQA